MNNEAIASIISALTGNNNVAQLATSFLGALNINQSAQPQVNSTTETVKDLNNILNGVEQNVVNNLTQVLQAAGIRM